MQLEYISVDGAKPVHPDTPIYRFFKLNEFTEMFQSEDKKRKLTLSCPEAWPDRFELGVLLNNRTHITIKELDCSFPLDPRQAWLQCWSRSPDSDVLMRAYSRVVNLGTDTRTASVNNTCEE